MRSFILVLSLLTSTLFFAQQKSFKITGTVVSKSDKSLLESATVHVERPKDSTLLTYTITNQEGQFVLEGKTYDDNLNLYISYVGYQSYKKAIKLTSKELNLATIELNDDSNTLDEVFIKSRAPITIKKDTVEFNVASFKTKKDANVEDVLKELPGVEVDENGKITVNGKEVSKILVNGKPFFGNDPTITTRNLTKDIIEKIQITDTKTKAQAFSGEESSGDDKTINLTIKEENNKGVFGRIAGGIGTDKRYEIAGMLNYFNNDRRISVLAGGNNINSIGFSFGEIEKMFGGGNTSFNVSSGGQFSFSVGGRSFGGGEGITSSKNTGFNYADKIGKKVDISADYFYSNSDSKNESSSERENILPDRRFFTSSNSNATNESNSHSANLEFDIAIDSTLLINIQPSLQYSTNKRVYNTYESSRETDESEFLTNESTADSYVENTGRNFENSFNITKKFGVRGAFLRFRLSNEFNATTTDDFLTSETIINGDNPETISRNQFTDSSDDTKNLETKLTYRLPISGKEFYLDLSHEYENEKRENIKSTYDFDDFSQDYTTFNTDLSTDFEYQNNRSEQGLRLTYRKDKLNINFGGFHVYRVIENNDLLRPELDLKRNFNSFEANSRLRYRFSSRKSISFRYNLQSNVPQIRQLQPFIDISNPLNITVGNPNLTPSNNHSFSFNFNNFNFQKGTGFYSYLWSNFNSNQVVSKSTIDENLLQTTTFTNVNGNYNIGVGSNYNISTKIDSVKTIRVGVGLNVSKNRTINFSNGIKYASTVTSLTPNLNITFSWKDVLEFRPNYRISFSKNSYDIDTFDDTDFLNHSLRLNLKTTVPKNLEWDNSITFSYNPNIADTFQKSAWFWNSSLGYSIMQDKGMLTLKGYDLLNQNTNARRRATNNYIEDSQSTVLQQYFMIGFSYKFNTLGKAGEVRGGRGFRMF